jgi:Fur family ferric uptake transcriptional regulator
MTSAPRAPALRFETVEGAIAAMRERGLRLSTPRRLILEDLFVADGPVSAEYVARRLSLDLASVYRNLETMERHGLVSHVHLGHGPGLYVLVGRGEREHLYCEGCGAVHTARPEELDALRAVVRAQFGYEARFTHFPIVGLCSRCAAGREPRGADPRHEHSHGDHVHAHEHAH